MTDPIKSETPGPDSPAPAPAAKRPYVKPAFVFEKAFETMALACGKINASQRQCKSNSKKS